MSAYRFGGYDWGQDGERVRRLVERMRGGVGVGALIGGGTGAGKTTLARALAGRAARLIPMDDPRSLDVLSRWGWWEDWAAVSVAGASAGNVILDDLGAEETEVAFGARREVAAQWLRLIHRLRAGGEWRGRLIVTTNYRGPELAARYGDAVTDRLAEMCAPLRLESASRRLVGVGVPAAAREEKAGGGWGGGGEDEKDGGGCLVAVSHGFGGGPWSDVAAKWRVVTA